MNEDEDLMVREAVALLIHGTSNSLNPDARRQWAAQRDDVVERLKVVLS